MELAKTIEQFLDRVRRKRAMVFTLNGVCLIIAALGGVYLAGNLVFYFRLAPDPQKALLFLSAILLLLLGVILTRYFIQGAFSRFSCDQAALLAEDRYPDLDNSLINAWQLHRQMAKPDAAKYISRDFVHRLVLATSARIKDIDPDSVIERKELSRNRNISIAILLLLGLASLFLPDFFMRGYRNFISPPIQAPLETSTAHTTSVTAPAPVPLPAYKITELTLQYNPPAYTRLQSSVIAGSGGKIEALPGTEVKITATSNLPATSAELAVNESDAYAMSLENDSKFVGTLIVKEQGFYQFRLQTGDGRKVTLPDKHSITLKKDLSPKIALLLANPKQVYQESDRIQLYYDGSDDFGIQKIDLVFDVNGKTTRKLLKTLKDGETRVTGGYAWNLSELALDPGDQAHYYLEILDNDNIQGPNTGRSATFSFAIFDSRKRMEDLISLQDALIENMVALLAKNLVGHKTMLSDSTTDKPTLKKLFALNADMIITTVKMAQTIREQAKSLQDFPAAYATLLENIVSGLNQIRQQHVDLLAQLDSVAAKASPVGLDFPPIVTVAEKLIQLLERDILFLVKISNRQKMRQIADLNDRLSNLAQNLREEFEKLRDKKDKFDAADLKARMQKIQQTLAIMMEQLSRQTLGATDEFLNSNAFKSLDPEKFNAAMEDIMNLINQGKTDEALKKLDELLQALNALSDQVSEMSQNSGELFDMETMKKIDDSIRNLQKMEDDQKKILESTTKINQAVRSAQLKKFEEPFKKLMAELKKHVNETQSLLKDMADFMDEHPDMKNYAELLKKEIQMNQEIQRLSQGMYESALKPDFAERIKPLNEARNKLSDLLEEKNRQPLKTYQDFKNFLPDFRDKYKTLDELAEMYDIQEFNSVFKNTYPQTFRWQHELRMNQKSNDSLAERLDTDFKEVQRLNAEISKKLGSMMYEMDKETGSFASKQDKEEMQRLARSQRQLRSEADKMSQQLSEMNRQNPMFSPDFSAKMSGAGRQMQSAENQLGQFNAPKSIDSENQALQQLAETRNMLNEVRQSGNSKKSSEAALRMGGGGRSPNPRREGATRMQGEKIDLPSEDRRQTPVEFRDDILKAMQRQYPKKYERFVMEYYKELVK